RVVDKLVDHVMQAVHVGVADVHARPLANRFETLEDLDVGARVSAASLQVESVGLVDLPVFFCGIVFVRKCHLLCSVAPYTRVRIESRPAETGVASLCWM